MMQNVATSLEITDFCVCFSVIDNLSSKSPLDFFQIHTYNVVLWPICKENSIM